MAVMGFGVTQLVIGAGVLVLVAGAATLVLATPGLYFLAGMVVQRDQVSDGSSGGSPGVG